MMLYFLLVKYFTVFYVPVFRTGTASNNGTNREEHAFRKNFACWLISVCVEDCRDLMGNRVLRWWCLVITEQFLSVPCLRLLSSLPITNSMPALLLCACRLTQTAVRWKVYSISMRKVDLFNFADGIHRHVWCRQVKNMRFMFIGNITEVNAKRRRRWKE